MMVESNDVEHAASPRGGVVGCTRRKLVRGSLGEVRRAVGMTQPQLAKLMGVGQNQVSKIEAQDDVLLSTLTHYMDCLGADVRVVVEGGGNMFEIKLAAANQE